MDEQTASSILKILIFLPLVLILAYISLKIAGGRMAAFGGGRIIKIVERVPLSNKGFLYVALIDGKPYVLSSTEERIEILMELPQEALEKRDVGEGLTLKESFMTNLSQLINRKDKS